MIRMSFFFFFRKFSIRFVLHFFVLSRLTFGARSIAEAEDREFSRMARIVRV